MPADSDDAYALMLMMLGTDGRLMLTMLKRGPADVDDDWG